MVSTVEASNSTQNDEVMDPVIPKPEPALEGSVCSSGSTPEAEVEALPADVAQTQKRKGGRKPVRNISLSSFILLVARPLPGMFDPYYWFCAVDYLSLLGTS